MRVKGHAFVSKYGEGFTTIPELAATVKVNGQDLPVLAPGVTHYVRQRNLERDLMCWELLLDLMEEGYEIEEAGGPGWKARDNRVKAQGVKECLALLNYGSTDEPSIKLIEAQAEIRYNQES